MAVMVEARSFRPFKSSEEYLYAMKEDLAEWLNSMYPDLYINVNNFMDRLDTGVALCKHANNVRDYASVYVERRAAAGKTNVHSIAASVLRVSPARFLPGAKPGTFFARDNVSNFIAWCRHGLGVFECLLFETDDLIMRKNEKHVILCLLEVARRAAKLGMPAPMLVHLEREIDREIAAERRLKFGGADGSEDEHESDMSDGEDCMEYGPIPQIVTNDLKSLDEMVRDEVEKCQCPTQFPMIRVSEGKYRIGDTKVLIFVRVLRSHVMVRVGGGWDTLSHYLDKHDPCRCRSAHRAAVSSKITGIRSGGPALEISHAQVHYDRSPPRTRRSSTSSNSSSGGNPSTIPIIINSKTPQFRSRSPMAHLSPQPTNRRSRSPTPRKTTPMSEQAISRSRSPTPYLSDRSRSGTPNRKTKKEKSFIKSNRDLTIPLNGLRSRSPSMTKSRSPSRTKSESRCGVDSSPTHKISDNFKDMCPDDPYIDTSSTCRVSENFVGTNQYSLLNPNPVNYSLERSSSGKQLDRSGVDVTPVAKISDNFVDDFKTELDVKKDQDSGSEVSDEGYKSLGVVTTPPANSNKTIVPLNGSPQRIRPPRSRSAGGDSPSPQGSPFRRNSKANQSARQSPTHRPNQHTPNTWSSRDSLRVKKRPPISEDTFCQQVTQLMKQYAAMMPSPRKDSKPESRIVTRIPAPVPVHKS